jgi:hypothetical protein
LVEVSVSKIIDSLPSRTAMAQEYKPGQIVPQSGVYTTHDPVHAGMPHEGRRIHLPARPFRPI